MLRFHDLLLWFWIVCRVVDDASRRKEKKKALFGYYFFVTEGKSSPRYIFSSAVKQCNQGNSQMRGGNKGSLQPFKNKFFVFFYFVVLKITREYHKDK